MNLRFPLLLLSCMLPVASLLAQDTPTHFIQKLWLAEIPGSLHNASYSELVVLRDNDPSKPRISRVTEPTLEFFLPAPGKANGAAVVICPGGGYAVLAYDHEGIQVAKWFAARGVSAAILKYRLPHSDIMSDKSVGPLQDAQEAIRHLRRRAAELHIDPSRIGIMGFSAGGHLAASASTRHAEPVYTPSDTTSARPDFSILCYAVISLQEGLTHRGSSENLLGPAPYKQELDRASNELRVDTTTPPAFLVHSQDDKTVPVQNSIQYYLALTRQGVAGELHLHEKGGHGYGLGVNPGSPAHWTKDLEAWLQRHGWASEAGQ